MKPPLSGLRVLELGAGVAGPLCGMILGDLGAEVIKIEPPEGEASRHSGQGKINGETPYFYSVNRNKKGLCLDLKQKEGKEIVLDLIKHADVILNNFRPGVMEKLGLDFENLKSINPRIINASITAFGRDGHDVKHPGYDHLLQGLSGIAYMNAEPGSTPHLVSLSIVDISAGLYTAIGILAALRGREINGGRGVDLDIALLDTAISYLNYHVANFFAFGEEPKRWKGGAHPVITPAQIFETKDSFINIFVGSDQFWKNLCRAIGRPDVAGDERFINAAGRYKNHDLVIELVQEQLVKRTTSEWLKIMEKEDIPAAGVNTFVEAVTDKRILARNMIAEYEHSVCGKVKVLGNPIKIRGLKQEYHSAPTHGEHNKVFIKKIS